MKKLNLSKVFSFLLLFSFFLFGSAICEDEEDITDPISNQQECVYKTFQNEQSIDKNNTDPTVNFTTAEDQLIGPMYIYTVNLNNVCVDHQVSVKGSIYCKGSFCSGGFEWGVYVYANDDIQLIDPVEFECYSGKCEFDVNIPADYTNLVDTHKLSISLVATGYPGGYDPMVYFAWKVDRFEIEINYHQTE